MFGYEYYNYFPFWFLRGGGYKKDIKQWKKGVWTYSNYFLKMGGGMEWWDMNIPSILRTVGNEFNPHKSFINKDMSYGSHSDTPCKSWQIEVTFMTQVHWKLHTINFMKPYNYDNFRKLMRLVTCMTLIQ